MGAYEIGLIDKDGKVDKKRKEELKLILDVGFKLLYYYLNINHLKKGAYEIGLIDDQGGNNDKQIQKYIMKLVLIC